jgi:hypothetical protein
MYLAKKHSTKGLGDEKAVRSHRSPPVSQKPQFYVQPTAVSAGPPPVLRRLFEVNSEPHTGARPSVRLCVGLITSFSNFRIDFSRLFASTTPKHLYLG